MTNKMAIVRFNKQNFLRSRGIDFYEVGDELCFNCPFCTDSRNRFFWNSNTGLSYCHNCDYAENIYQFLSNILRITYRDAEVLVESGNKVSRIYTNKVKVDRDKIIEFPSGHNFLDFPVTKKNKRYWEYVTRERGIDSATALGFRLGFTRIGYYKNRVIVPVYWFDNLVSFCARDITGEADKKILTPSGNHQSNYLLNLDNLWGQKTVVLVEGPFDLLKLPDVAVCSFGKRLHAVQKSLLRKAGVETVVVCYDNDAQEETYGTARALSEMFRTLVVEMPEGEDPGSLPVAETKSLIMEAKEFKRKRMI